MNGKNKSLRSIQKVLSVLLAVVVLFTLSVPTFAANRAKSGTAGWTSKSEWYLWSQGASTNSQVKKAGCRTVAYAKMIAEAGYAEFNNPDEFSTYLKSNGYVNSRYQETKAGAGPKAYTDGAIKLVGRLSIKNLSKSAVNKQIMKKLQQGYYVCLMGSAHTTYVLREASLNAGYALISDSWGSWAYSEYANNIKYTKYNYAKFSSIWYFSVEPKPASESDDTNKVIDNGEITTSNDLNEVNLADGLYKFKTSDKNYFVDVYGDNKSNSTNIRIATESESNSQTFYVHKDYTGWYKITHINSGRNLALQIPGGGKGVNVILWDEYDSNDQRWKFFSNENGFYIMSARGYFLDVSNDEYYNGNNIQVWTRNNTAAQRFYPRKLSRQYGMISYDVDESLVIHRTKDYKSSSAIGLMPEGQIVEVISRSGKFAYVSYNGLKGWCAGKYVIDMNTF